MSEEQKNRRPNPVTLRLKPDLVQAVKQAAAQAGQTRNAYLREAVQSRLRRDKQG